MEFDQETGKKIQELQILEQNFQALLMQKQNFQIELTEVTTAIEEVQNSKDDVFKIIGQVMVKSNKDSLKKELHEKRELLDLRMKAIEKQENTLRDTVERLKGDIVDKIN